MQHKSRFLHTKVKRYITSNSLKRQIYWGFLFNVSCKAASLADLINPGTTGYGTYTELSIVNQKHLLKPVCIWQLGRLQKCAFSYTVGMSQCVMEDQGPVSISEKKSYRKISLSLDITGLLL